MFRFIDRVPELKYDQIKRSCLFSSGEKTLAEQGLAQSSFKILKYIAVLFVELQLIFDRSTRQTTKLNVKTT